MRDIDKRLFVAIISKDIEKISVCMDAGADIHSLNDSHNRPVLHFSVMESNEKVVRFLLESGADVHVRDQMKNSALHRASWNDDAEIARTLIEFGADLNARDNRGYTPLFDSIRGGKMSVSHALIEAGADIFSQADDGSTVIHQAIRCSTSAADTPAFIKTLVESGVDINARDHRQKTALHLIPENYTSSEGTLKALIEHGANLDAADGKGKTALHLAVSKGRLSLVEILVQAGADANIRCSQKKTPMREAALGGMDYIVDALAPFSDATTKSDSLYFLIESGKTSLARFLLKSGADPNAFGGKLLLQAIRHNRIGIAKSLITAGADVHIKDKRFGRTFLHWTAHFNRNTLIPKLIKMGVDPDAHDFSGKTALHIAIEEHQLETVDLLIQEKVDLNLKNAAGETPLMCALSQDDLNPSIVQSLVQAGADVNQTNCNGNFPLLYAALSGNESVINSLMKEGAIWSEKDRQSAMRLGVASSLMERIDSSVTQELLKNISLMDDDLDGVDSSHDDEAEHQRMRL